MKRRRRGQKGESRHLGDRTAGLLQRCNGCLRSLSPCMGVVRWRRWSSSDPLEGKQNNGDQKQWVSQGPPPSSTFLLDLRGDTAQSKAALSDCRQCQLETSKVHGFLHFSWTGNSRRQQTYKYPKRSCTWASVDGGGVGAGQRDTCVASRLCLSNYLS